MNYKNATLIALLLLSAMFTGLKAQTVTDIDGNVYNTIKIGTQVWLKENLKVTKYNNGDAIATTNPVTADIAQEESNAKYQWAYEGDENNVKVYGRLYTYHAIADSRKVCPAGWHVPSDKEWQTLATFLGGEDIAGEKLKEKGTSHWQSDMAANNESGFTAVAGGYRNANGTFGGLAENGFWRSSTANGDYFAWYLGMTSGYKSLYRDYNIPKENGLSVRCLKD
jgi:uncharacterized protein (TIGR02145 family)